MSVVPGHGHGVVADDLGDGVRDGAGGHVRQPELLLERDRRARRKDHRRRGGRW